MLEQWTNSENQFMLFGKLFGLGLSCLSRFYSERGDISRIFPGNVYFDNLNFFWVFFFIFTEMASIPYRIIERFWKILWGILKIHWEALETFLRYIFGYFEDTFRYFGDMLKFLFLRRSLISSVLRSNIKELLKNLLRQNLDINFTKFSLLFSIFLKQLL